MSSDPIMVFHKENLDSCLQKLGKEYRRLVGKGMPAELILVGGAAVLTSYGFRESTYDVDAIIQAASAMRDAINSVGDEMGLPAGWLNEDFTQTNSFSPRLSEFSSYYKTFSNVLQVRTVRAQYLVAMKLASAREYKNDLSDIIGILLEHQRKGAPLTWAQIDQAVQDLYGSWNKISPDARAFIQRAVAAEDYERLYAECRQGEQDAFTLLAGFDETYPEVLREANLKDILAKARAKRDQNGSS